jgi:beta-xylosidase
MERLWKADLGDGRYRNPILFADYSDPDVVRVGDTYYMTASSFNYIPGLPILISRDLVNWKLVNYALQKIDYENYNTPQHAKGVWAPAIRWHEGHFYIFYGMPDEGIFMVKTKDALGDWEKPVCVMEGKGRIDPCPFWDDDGRAYVIHAYAKSRIGFNGCLGIFEIDPVTLRAVSEDCIFYDGTKTQPTIEGPKVYKRNGMYYILAPAGGVRKGWQTALRAADIHGPYEEKIVLKQGNTDINGPHQGGLTDTVNGDEWFVHFQDRGLYGRIVHLQPVTWGDGWPVMGSNITDGCGEPVREWTCPDMEPAGKTGHEWMCQDNGYAEDAASERRKTELGGAEVPCYLEASDDFEDTSLNLMWQWMGNPRDDFYSLRANRGKLRLYSRNPNDSAAPVLWECSNVLTQKLVCPEFEAECQLDAGALKSGERAGLVMMGGEYAFLAVQKSGDRLDIVYGISQEENGNKTEDIVTVAQNLDGTAASAVTFSLMLMAGPRVNMYYQIGSGAKTEVAQAASFIPSDHTWVGAKLGLFAVAETANRENIPENANGVKEPAGNVVAKVRDAEGSTAEGGYADFAYFHVKALSTEWGKCVDN